MLSSCNLVSELAPLYNGSPMMDAVRHKHDKVAEYLRSQGAILELDDAAGQLCDAAARNDVLALRRLVENAIDVNEGDYDKRTALHLAASNGCQEALRHLLTLPGINTSPVDRLG